MNSYTYTAIDSVGNVQHGTLDASDLARAIGQLAEQNLVVLSIAIRDEATVNQEKQLKTFHGNLGHLLVQREEWLPALDAACDELPVGPTRREIQVLAQQLRSPYFDRPVSDLLNHATIIQLLPLLGEADDAVGSPSPLHQWLSGILKQRELQAQQRKRLIYPTALCGLSLILLIAFAFFLIPLFREMYDEFGLVLPPPTALVFWASEQATTYLPRTVGSLAIALLIFVPLVHLWRSRSLSNRLLGRIVAGRSSNLVAMSALTSTLAHMLSLGAPLTEALRIAGKASRSFFYERAAIELSNQLVESSSVNTNLSSHVLPPTLLFALHAEPNGLPSVHLLHALALNYGERAKNRVDWLTTMMPIVAIVGIGLGVGFVVISLFMPLVSMISSLA